jgi:hypothetical protein
MIGRVAVNQLKDYIAAVLRIHCLTSLPLAGSHRQASTNVGPTMLRIAASTSIVGLTNEHRGSDAPVWPPKPASKGPRAP